VHALPPDRRVPCLLEAERSRLSVAELREACASLRLADRRGAVPKDEPGEHRKRTVESRPGVPELPSPLSSENADPWSETAIEHSRLGVS
jgi:hypothetical protein